MNIDKINRGSEWRKWDLHVHTPLSIEQEYGGNTPENWERFISDLERLPSEIKIIGINDYIFIDGYKKVLDEKQKGRLSNIELILPVIELRIDKFANVSEDDPLERINFHIIFSNELTSEQIESQFLNALSAEYKLETEYDYDNESDWSGVITRENIELLGKKLIESSKGKIKGSPFDKVKRGVLGDGHDRWRTAAMRFGIGEFSAGFNLFTGERYSDSYESIGRNQSTWDDQVMNKYNRKNPYYKNGVRYNFGLVKEEGKRYRLGAAYVGWGNYRIGIDSDRYVRYPIQNVLAHDWISPQPGFEVLSNKITPYFQYQTHNPFTSW